MIQYYGEVKYSFDFKAIENESEINMNKKIILLLSVICLIAAATGYYFLYFIKTPEYALNKIRQSVQQHDVGTFEKHVDLDSIYSKCFDDILIAESKIHHVETNPVAIGVFSMMKPAVVELVKKETLAQVSGTAPAVTPTSKPGVPPENGNVIDAMKVNFQRKAHWNNLKIKELKLVKPEQAKPEKGKADVSLIVTNTELNKDYSLLLKMVFVEDEYWKIKEIANLPQTLFRMEAAYKAKRAAANRPIMERLKRALSLELQNLEKVEETPSAEEINISGIDTDKPMPHMVATVIITNKTNRTVNRIYYDLILKTKDKNQIVYSHSEHFAKKIGPGKMVQVVNRKLLNEDIPADKQIGQADLKTLNWELIPSYISFDDGHVISPNQFYY